MITDQLTLADQEHSGSAAVLHLALSHLFQDGVILQRDRRIPVWGRAVPGSRILCTLDGTSAVTYATRSGEFYLTLPPHAPADHLTMVLSSREESVTIREVAVGDVFHISGQSNMQFDLEFGAQQKLDENPFSIRCFRVIPDTAIGGSGDVSGHWTKPEERRGFSALGYYFALRISQLRQVPVGLVDTSVGGVNIETFLSAKALKRIPELRSRVEEFDAHCFDPERDVDRSAPGFNADKFFFDQLKRVMPALPPVPDSLAGWERPGFDDSAWQEQDLPDSWTHAGHPGPGRCFYRKRVTIPAAWQGKALTLSLGACDRADKTWVNGTFLGGTGDPSVMDFWDTVRVYSIPAEAVSGPELTIAVDVSSLVSVCTHGGMTGPEDAMFLACGEEKIPLSGTWKLTRVADTGNAPMAEMIYVAGGDKAVHLIYDNALRPLARFQFCGGLWYQGEANALCNPEVYQRMLEELIRDWRELWGEDLPVLTFVLPGFQRPHLDSPYSTWAIIREAQLRGSLVATGFPAVSITDAGDTYNIHPGNKRLPGFRAAEQLEAQLHGGAAFGAVCLGAVAKSATEATLAFNTRGAKLTLKSDSPGIAGIGFDGRTESLRAEVTAPDRIKVTLPEFPVQTIAYGWCDNPIDGGILSDNGIPAFPFRLEL